MSDRANRSVTRLAWLACFAGCLAGACALCGFCFTTCNPTDRVDVTFRHVPGGTTKIGIVADANGTAALMVRYLVPPMAPFGITNGGGGIEWEWREPVRARPCRGSEPVAVLANTYSVDTCYERFPHVDTMVLSS